MLSGPGWSRRLLGIMLTTRPRALLPSFLCGFAARLARNLLIGWQVNVLVAVAIGAGICVVIATILVRTQRDSTVALITGILPLGAAVSVFDAIRNLLQLATLKGEALTQPAIALVASLSSVIATTAAIIFGLFVGYLVATPLRPAAPDEGQ